MSAGPVCVATIAGAHGVAGDLRLVAHTEPPAALARFERLRLEPEDRTRALRCLRPWKEGWIARLEGIDSRERAAALAGRKLLVPREMLGEPLDKDDFYHADLIGMTVLDPAGEPLGKIIAVHNYGAGDLLDITLEAPVEGFGRALLLPFTGELVPAIDTAAGYATIDLAAWLARQAVAGDSG